MLTVPRPGHGQQPNYAWSVSFVRDGSPSLWHCSISIISRAAALFPSRGLKLFQITHEEEIMRGAWLLKTLPLKGVLA